MAKAAHLRLHMLIRLPCKVTNVALLKEQQIDVASRDNSFLESEVQLRVNDV
jgi:hypothetical protein